MRLFSELREKVSSGKVVYDKKMKRIPTKIVKTNKGFATYIDGELLDTYRSEAEAMKMLKTAVKELS